MTALTKSDLLRHFGLTRDPFGAPHEPGDLWPAPSHAQVADLLRYAVMEREIVAILGDIGTGKTVATWAVHQLGSIARPILIAGDKAALTIGQVVETFLRELEPGIPLPHSQPARRRLLNVSLRQLRQKVCTAVVLIDEAHRLRGELLKSLKELHEQSRWGMQAATFGVVLTGHRSLAAAYDAVAPDVLRRLEAHNILRIGRLLPVQARDYALHRLAAAGAPHLVEPGALDGLAGLAAPLDVNARLWRLLAAAARAGEKRLTRARVEAEVPEGGALDLLHAANTGRTDPARLMDDLLKGEGGPHGDTVGETEAAAGRKAGIAK